MKKILLLIALIISLNAEATIDIEKLESECSKKNGNSCYLASIYYTDKDDEDKSIKYMMDACRNKKARACIVIAKGLWGLGKHDLAFDMLKATCNMGEEKVCAIYVVDAILNGDAR